MNDENNELARLGLARFDASEVEKWSKAAGQTSDAEQRNGADLPQQTCPSCAGKGERYINRYYPEECDVCFGTGHV